MSLILRVAKSKYVIIVIDIFLSIPVFFAAIISKIFRKIGIEKLKISTKIFDWVGVVPVSDHYYQPLISPAKHLTKSLMNDRQLPGINMNIESQLELLSKINYRNELEEIPIEDNGASSFFFHNGSFEVGDSEILYSFIRHFKPKKIIEIGSGNSTLVALKAIHKNALENNNAVIVCVEPYEQKWLEDIKDITVIREKVEEIHFSEFESLTENDFLFIDSSHIIRPQGDVLFEFLELLPKLKKGVIIHIHDIYTPKDYPKEMILEKRFLWNEQYLLEAFLSFNDHFEIICSLNYLKHHYFDAISKVCPLLAKEPKSEPGSFWIKKIS